LAGLVVLVVSLLAFAVGTAGSAAAADTFRFGNATTSWWAPVTRAAEVRAQPSPAGEVVARVSTRTPEGTTNIVRLLERISSGGALWLRIGFGVLPNGTTGWIRRADVGGYQRTTTRLVVDRSTFRATLYRGRARVLTARIGVGDGRWPTPAGTFFVRNRLTRYASPAYGPIAFGLSARSAVLTDWPAGGFVGIHGTNHPEILPGHVSHGCIRLRNPDILRLARLLAPGDLVVIR
jgi:lipoprotein-anchoring transpeptidase ErfK/SrfK